MKKNLKHSRVSAREKKIAAQQGSVKDLDIKRTGEINNDMLYHSVLKFYLIDHIVGEISRHNQNLFRSRFSLASPFWSRT